MVKFHTMRRKSREGKCICFFSNDVFVSYSSKFPLRKASFWFFLFVLELTIILRRKKKFYEFFWGKNGDYCVAQLTPGPPGWPWGSSSSSYLALCLRSASGSKSCMFTSSWSSGIIGSSFAGSSFSSFGTIAGSIDSGNSTLNWMMSFPFSKGLRYVGMPSPKTHFRSPVLMHSPIKIKNFLNNMVITISHMYYFRCAQKIMWVGKIVGI